MGGGDLNLKKSWHPHTMKNQEKVWKAEQAKNAEDRKMNDLRKEIMEEKNREELIKIGQTSGVLNKNDDKKLEWMYKSSSELINREDYLLGKPIDKAFELMVDEESQKNKDMVGIKVPVNHVEHECIPFSIRSYRNATTPSEQVDLQRKILEDPLMMIKQKEMESRRKILENPVKLKELHRILKTEKSITSKSKSKKSKKSKKGKKKHRGSDSDDSESSEKDLDEMLQKQYKKLKGLDKDSKQLAGLDLSKLLDAKYETISKELDKAAKSKKKKSKSKKRKTSSSDSESENDDTHKYRNRNRTENTTQKRNRSRSRSQVNRRDEQRVPKNYSMSDRRDFYTNRNKNYSSYDQPNSRSRKRSHSRSQSPRKQENPNRRRSKSPSKWNNSRKSRSRSQSPQKREKSYRNRSKSPTKWNYPKSSTRQDRNYSSKPSAPKERLTEEEKEKRLKDMMDNAAWRDKERTKYVQNYRDGYKKEEEQNKARDFDKEFINTQLRKAISTQNSVESRIKSNVNNIQRTSAAMNANFARK